MNRLLLAILLSFAVGPALHAQTASVTDTPQGVVVLTKLLDAVYPAIALTAQIKGDVELLVNIRRDGRVDTVSVVNGPPLLQRAALSSANASQFECLNCVDELTPYHLFYNFRLDVPPVACKVPDDCGKAAPGAHATEVAQSENHITITGHPSPVCICDFVLRVRSVKCLYLWRCAIR